MPPKFSSIVAVAAAAAAAAAAPVTAVIPSTCIFYRLHSDWPRRNLEKRVFSALFPPGRRSQNGHVVAIQEQAGSCFRRLVAEKKRFFLSNREN